MLLYLNLYFLRVFYCNRQNNDLKYFLIENELQNGKKDDQQRVLKKVK